MGMMQGKVLDATSFAKYGDTLEKSEDFAYRINKWWSDTLQKFSALQDRVPPYNVLIVSHGGWIQTLVRTLVGSRKLTIALGVTIDTRCLNVSITRIETDGNRKGVVVQYGDTSHLITKAVENNVDVI